jgi:hypothetical protein
MLCKPEHGASEDAGKAIPVEFLLAFVRCMIREYPSSDVYYLAVASAKKMFPITPEQELAFMKAVMHETTKSRWPKGFF